jgi:hypothetical protein
MGTFVSLPVDKVEGSGAPLVFLHDISFQDVIISCLCYCAVEFRCNDCGVP